DADRAEDVAPDAGARAPLALVADAHGAVGADEELLGRLEVITVECQIPHIEPPVRPLRGLHGSTTGAGLSSRPMAGVTCFRPGHHRAGTPGSSRGGGR